MKYMRSRLILSISGILMVSFALSLPAHFSVIPNTPIYYVGLMTLMSGALFLAIGVLTPDESLNPLFEEAEKA